jgi:hypothetical protein
MKWKFGFILLFNCFLIVECNNNHSDSSRTNNFKAKKEDTVKTTVKTDNMEKDSLRSYDTYQFSNDTLVQDVYISYIAPNEIKFLVKTTNKTSLHKCEYSGVAIMANGEGTAQGSDELKDDELYGVYEYFTKQHPFFTIDIEFKRGNRMTIFTKDDKAMCAADCPLSSQGTIRRIILSKGIQHNPTW